MNKSDSIQIRGYVAEPSYLALHSSAQPDRVILIAGRLAANVLPKRQMYLFLAFIFSFLDRILSLEKGLRSRYPVDMLQDSMYPLKQAIMPMKL